MSVEGAIAANRFGLGAKPGEIEAASNNPKSWLLRQLAERSPEPWLAGFDDGQTLTQKLVETMQARRQARAQAADKNATPDKEAIRDALMRGRQAYLKEMTARFQLGFETDQPFRERLVRFWSNHFVVSIQKPQCALFVGAFEREAIRPHVTGTFADMVLAVERHPAMLLYLDNAQSIGPDSPAGKMVGRGLNENLAREIMELHTLGVDGGYTQDDVIALARILTGWSLNRPGGMAAGQGGPIRRLLGARPLVASADPSDTTSGFRFFPARHEPGTKTLLGKTYAAGYEGGEQALRDLAHHPATARHIATKLAIHFIADDPPHDSVARIEKAFRDSGGDLKATSTALVEDPAAWNHDTVKVRSPLDYVTAAMRAVGPPRDPDGKGAAPLVQAARAMGEVPFAAPSPKGWPDDAASWTGSDAVLERVQWANAAGQKWGNGRDPVTLAENSLGPLLTPQTRIALTRAESPAQGLALLLASPEFQRR